MSNGNESELRQKVFIGGKKMLHFFAKQECVIKSNLTSTNDKQLDEN